MPPWTPIREAGSIVSAGREVWVKIRADGTGRVAHQGPQATPAG